MIATGAGKHGVLRPFLTSCVLIGCLNNASLPAQSSQRLPRLTLSFTAGAARPLNSTFRELYGSVQVPFSGQADFGVSRRFSAFAGFRYLSAGGSTAVAEPQVAVEEYALRFRMYSAKAGISFALPSRKLALRAGAGISYNRYSERVEGTDFSTRGSRAGFLAQATVDYPLTRRFSVIGRFEYSTIRGIPGPDSETKINLGATELSAGLAIKLL